MGNDQIYGGDGNDYINGDKGSDRISSGDGDDNLQGDDGDEYIYGGNGSDYTSTAGNNDYALITDFNPQEDFITLIGQPTDYLLKATSGSLPAGTGIYINKPGNEPDELISILKDISPIALNLSNSYFFYTNPEPISIPRHYS